jgi:hypothetical protein
LSAICLMLALPLLLVVPTACGVTAEADPVPLTESAQPPVITPTVSNPIDPPVPSSSSPAPGPSPTPEPTLTGRPAPG